MRCPHSLKPGPCSQCLGATPRVVTNDGNAVLIDGTPTGRAIDRADEIRLHYARRGGRARKARR